MRLVLSASLLLSLAACGQVADDAADGAFDTGFTRSCEQAAGQGLPADTAASLCACALGKINAQLTAQEKQDLSPEEAQPLMAECLSEAGLQPTG